MCQVLRCHAAKVAPIAKSASLGHRRRESGPVRFLIHGLETMTPVHAHKPLNTPVLNSVKAPWRFERKSGNCRCLV